MVVTLAALSLLLQLAAAFWALFAMRRTGLLRPWLLLATALLLMAARRVVTLRQVVLQAGAVPEHLAVDVAFSALIAAVLLAAVIFAQRALVQLAQQRKELAAAREMASAERQRLAQLVRALPVGVVVEGPEGIAFANAYALALFGLEDWQARGTRFASYLHPEDRTAFEKALQGSSGSSRVQVRALAADGSVRTLGVRCQKAVWEGKPALVVTFADITEQLAEQTERETLGALFAEGPVVLMEWAPPPSRACLRVSDNVRQWGFDPQALLREGRSFHEYVHPEDRQRLAGEAAEYFARGEAGWVQEYRLLCPDGQALWVLDRTVVSRDHQGQVVGFRGYLLDITEQVAARQLLEAERARYAAVLEATREVVYDWDMASGNILWNRNVLPCFGYTQQAMGGIAQWEERIHPEDRARVLEALQATVEEGKPFEVEYRFQRANGSYAHVYDRGIVERDAQGRPVRMVGAMADLTALRELQQQLATAQRLEALGQLAGGVAHDFNNLLTAIYGSLDLLERKLPTTSPVRQDLAPIRQAAERAATLTRQLLTFARRQVMEPQPLDLNAHIQGTVGMLQRVIPENIRVEFIPGRQLGTVYADPVQLDQVLMNLVVNARDAMPNGGVITIETENVLVNGEFVAKHPWAKEGRYVVLSVSDTGVGMDEATRNRIFEPFFTTKEPGKGTGLGLATVYGIVKQHDGMIHVYSEPGKGTTFKVYLPIVERRAVEVGPKLEGPVVGGSETVLLVEDEKEVREILAQVLASLGYQVLTAQDGLEALALLEARQFAVDLVVSDVVMPGLGGWELYQKVQERAPGVLFLFSTGYSENAVHVNFHKKEGVFLITKPYGLDAFARKVRQVLDSRKR